MYSQRWTHGCEALVQGCGNGAVKLHPADCYRTLLHISLTVVCANHVKPTLSHDKCVTVSARDGLPSSPPFVKCFCGAHAATRQALPSS